MKLDGVKGAALTSIYQSPLGTDFLQRTLWTSDASRRRFRICASFVFPGLKNNQHVYIWFLSAWPSVQRFLFNVNKSHAAGRFAGTNVALVFCSTHCDRQGSPRSLNLQESLRSGHQLFMCFQAVVELLRHSLERFRVTAYIACKPYEMMLHFETDTVCSWNMFSNV